MIEFQYEACEVGYDSSRLCMLLTLEIVCDTSTFHFFTDFTN